MKNLRLGLVALLAFASVMVHASLPTHIARVSPEAATAEGLSGYSGDTLLLFVSDAATQEELAYAIKKLAKHAWQDLVPNNLTGIAAVFTVFDEAYIHYIKGTYTQRPFLGKKYNCDYIEALLEALHKKIGLMKGDGLLDVRQLRAVGDQVNIVAASLMTEFEDVYTGYTAKDTHNRVSWKDLVTAIFNLISPDQEKRASLPGTYDPFGPVESISRAWQDGSAVRPGASSSSGSSTEWSDSDDAIDAAAAGYVAVPATGSGYGWSNQYPRPVPPSAPAPTPAAMCPTPVPAPVPAYLSAPVPAARSIQGAPRGVSLRSGLEWRRVSDMPDHTAESMRVGEDGQWWGAYDRSLPVPAPAPSAPYEDDNL